VVYGIAVQPGHALFWILVFNSSKVGFLENGEEK
jgi:hypothetical protein